MWSSRGRYARQIWNHQSPMVKVWTAEDEEQLVQLSNKEINMSETYLGRYAALQTRNAVAAILDFTNEEWESVRSLREAYGAVVMADGALGTLLGHWGTGTRLLGTLLKRERCN